MDKQKESELRAELSKFDNLEEMVEYLKGHFRTEHKLSPLVKSTLVWGLVKGVSMAHIPPK